MKTILSVAGFDPSSGAGTTRDVDTFLSLGIHGLALPTATVVQGPQGVKSIHPTPKEQFIEILDLIKNNINIDGIKIGVICDEFFIEAMTGFIRNYRKIPVVIDPVIVAKNGMRLITEEGTTCLLENLFPLATVVTPNIPEASKLTGHDVKNLEDMKECAVLLKQSGPRVVVVKGGHLEGNPVDLFFDGTDFFLSEKNRAEKEIHGTGCSFSSLIAAFLVHGYPPVEAFQGAEEKIKEIITGTYRINEKGYFYISTGACNSISASKWEILEIMKEAKERLTELNMVGLVPEVQMNIGFAMPGARGIEDVAAFPGRIGHFNGRLVFKGGPEFGASSHVARLVLTYMQYYPHVRSCANLRYDDKIIEQAKENNFTVVFFDRRQEPDKIRTEEGRSLDFLVDEVLQKTGFSPDIIYDTGDVGKEPIIRLFARNPLELIEKMEKIQL